MFYSVSVRFYLFSVSNMQKPLFANIIIFFFKFGSGSMNILP